MNQDEIGRKIVKKILVPNSVPTRPRQENSEKKKKKSIKAQKTKKPSFWHYLYPKWDEIGRERQEKSEKNFSPKFHSDTTRAREFQVKLQKNSKIQKNLIPAFFFLSKPG